MEKVTEKKNNDTDIICHDILVSIRRIMQAVDLHSRYLLRNYGLTGPQLYILQELTNQGEMSIGELAKAICLGQATVTGILTRLEKQKLITRRRCKQDKRRVLVKTTKLCKRLLQSAPPPIQETFIQQFSTLLDWEQNMILSSLQRLVSMMDTKKLKVGAILAAGPIGNTSN
ncbi:MAG: MarR family transcriptional regulator [Deltaproteobacteria bacterium]|nr:MarR family transcriptional regulator [Deltaproteobacteria bacterium]MBW2153210.1 MarR family transcriptional regulator [Deltaproteobacteria bacterium]